MSLIIKQNDLSKSREGGVMPNNTSYYDMIDSTRANTSTQLNKVVNNVGQIVQSFFKKKINDYFNLI